MEKPDYQFAELVAKLVDKIDDWRRGLRDWDEVEPILAKVRDEVKETDETSTNRGH